jgi:hypothetical protein
MGSLFLLLCLGLTYQAPPPQAPSVLGPWPEAAAQGRQAFLVTAAVPRKQPTVVLTSMLPHDVPVRVVLGSDYNHPLALFRDPVGRLHLRLPADVTPDRPQVVYAYWSAARGWAASPNLDAPPLDADDYATTAHGHAWDFDRGDQGGITSWGNRSYDYGKVEVRDGRLLIPVTGNDPWFLWGIMWGSSDDPLAEHIDSRLYSGLTMRVRQSCAACRWSIFFTDRTEHFEMHDFWVRGTDWQVLSFDLRQAFGGFWDGREMRSFRIDPTNDTPNTTVEIDWVRIDRSPTETVSGPVMSPEQVEARTRVKSVMVGLPAQARAGERVLVQAAGVDDSKKLVPSSPLFVGQREGERMVYGCTVMAGPDGAMRADVPVGTRAGPRDWVLALADDLGRPMAPFVTRPLAVKAAALDHYELSTPRALVYVDQPLARITVWGADRFGNHLPVDVRQPRWDVTGGARPAPGHVRGAPAVVAVTCSRQPVVHHTITLADAAGHTGSLELTTVGLKPHPVKLTPNGYMVLDDGKLYMPLGGFYANWPSALPQPDGRVGRALDLFTCGPAPYQWGYPWPPEVEKQVADFLALCHSHGITGLRLMLRNMDLVGRADQVQVKAVLHMLDLARPLGIRFNVALLEDYDKPPYCNAEVLEKVVLPHYGNTELDNLPSYRRRFLVEKRLLGNQAAKYTDPEAIACQKDYLRDLLPHLMGRDEIFCYEFENEMVFPPMSWVNEMADFIRGIDPRTLVLGNPGPHEWPEPRRWARSQIDLFCYHPYNDGDPSADHGAIVFMRSKWAAAAGKPFLTGEGGINQNRWQADVKKCSFPYGARGMRDQIWTSLCCGANGAFMWTPEHELELSEFGSVEPALRALGLDLRTMSRKRPGVCVVMPDDDSANGKAYAVAWRLLDAGVDFDTVPVAAARGYERVLRLAEVDPARIGEAVSGLASELGRPAKGYQMCYLADAKRQSVLIYLRNVAGGIVNLGDSRALYLRDPQPARAEIHLQSPAKRWNVRAFDLDALQPVPVVLEADGTVLVADSSSHDYAVALTR